MELEKPQTEEYNDITVETVAIGFPEGSMNHPNSPLFLLDHISVAYAMLSCFLKFDKNVVAQSSHTFQR